MNSYQMVLHRPVETARVIGKFSHSLQIDPLPKCLVCWKRLRPVSNSGASSLRPTLPAPASKLAGDPVRKGAKDGAPELLRPVKGGPPADYMSGLQPFAFLVGWDLGLPAP